MQMNSWQVESFGKPLVQALREVPAPAGTEVVLRIASCGVCHSDVHMHDGYFDLGGGHRLDLARTVQPPRTLGHEIAGLVAAVGPDAQGCRSATGASPIRGSAAAAARCARRGRSTCTRRGRWSRSRRWFREPCGGAASLLPGGPRRHSRRAGLHLCLRRTDRVQRTAQGRSAGARRCAAGPGRRRRGAVRHPDGAPAVQRGLHRRGTRSRKVGPCARGGRVRRDRPRRRGHPEVLPESDGGGAAAVVDFVGSGASFDFGFGALRKGGKMVCRTDRGLQHHRPRDAGPEGGVHHRLVCRLLAGTARAHGAGARRGRRRCP